MSLSEIERLILANQYRILAYLNSDPNEKRFYEENVEVLTQGYELHYNSIDLSLISEANITRVSEC